MKLDTDGLDGVLRCPAWGAASSQTPPPVDREPQPQTAPQEAAAAPVIAPYIPERAEHAADITGQEGLPVAEPTGQVSRPAGIFYTGGETALSMPVVPSGPPVAAEPPVVSPREENGDDGLPRYSTPRRGRWIPALVLSLGGVIALATVLLTRSFQSDPGVTIGSGVVPVGSVGPARPPDPVPAAPARSRSPIAEVGVREDPAAAADGNDREDPAARAPTGPLRFPGTYRRSAAEPLHLDQGAADRILEQMRRCKGNIRIIGHACALGDDDTNRRISVRRARAVSRYFVEHGFDEDRLIVRGKGSTDPIADNDTHRGRIQNRRVDISCR